jgi:hypothetical protein
VWGDSGRGGTDAPSGNDYTKIYSTNGAFATLKADGSIKAWGDPNRGGTGAPAGSGYTKIYSVTPRLDCSIGFKSGKGIPS